MFSGHTYDPATDEHRLTRQLGRVWVALQLADQWLTLRELAHRAEAPEASVAARLRDLRKDQFGGYVIDRRRRGEPRRGLWEYRMAGRAGAGQQALF